MERHEPASPQHPYRGRPDAAVWRSAFRTPATAGPESWYTPRFGIAGLTVATAGSCFAQHIARELRHAGCDVIDAEPAPHGLSPEDRARFGYGVYSARYGNIYTSRQLLQLLQRATGEFVPHSSSWAYRDGYVDPFRPTLEPEPFCSVEELERVRRGHLRSVVSVFESADVFVFTFGLTEMWIDAADGAALPLAPGVAGGRYDHTRHRFVNLTVADVVDDMERLFVRARSLNPGLRFLLTVSPVPLAATATDQHVVVASSRSKAVLRAACSELVDRHSFVDYFPSYEIVTSHMAPGESFAADGRTVTPAAVDRVMRCFLAAHGIEAARRGVGASAGAPSRECEEELLAAAAQMR